ncbi:hypothetical protein O7635_09735 [Asanoa sp. WMMD1127]|uniref:hypothetical protein n=1 Tax=Asanoa sp. WMMD1127 TaxID=3016107 RepID=UPI002417794C|nr:hypothetical protein [Asanoa sp. WMMD1127]MDG4822134.1 hypothetical protein [Asanoa sp. WMMD1127]
MDYRDWARGDDTPVTAPRSRSPRSPEDRPRRTGGRRGTKPTAAEPNPDAISQWDPLGASGGELAAITQLEDTASFKLPKDFWEDEPGSAAGDQVITPTGGGGRRRRDRADDEIELSSGGRRRRDVSDSRAGRYDDEVELSSGGSRRRDVADSRAGRFDDDEIELSSGGRRRRDASDSRAGRFDDDEVELSSGGRRRRAVGDSRATRVGDDQIELPSGGLRRRDITDSRAGRYDDDDIELSSGGRRRRDVADSRASRLGDDEIELSSGGRRRRDDVSDSRAGRRDAFGEIELSSGGRRRRDDVGDSRGGLELPRGGRRRLEDAEEADQIGPGRRWRADTDPDPEPVRRSWQDEATDTELPSVGYATGGRRARREDGGDSEPVSRARRRRQAADETETADRGWQTEPTDTGSVQVPSLGRRGRSTRDDADEPSQTWHGESAAGGRRSRHADPDAGRPSWSESATGYVETTGRRSRADDEDPPVRSRRARRDADALETRGRRDRHGDETDPNEQTGQGWSGGARSRHAEADPVDHPSHGRRAYSADSDSTEPVGRSRRRADDLDPSESAGRGRRAYAADSDSTDPAGRGRRAYAADSDSTEPAGRGRRAYAADSDSAEPAGRSRRGRTGDEPAYGDWRDAAAAAELPTQSRRSRDDDASRRGPGWRADPPAGDVPEQRRRGRHDDPDLTTRRADPDRGRTDWRPEPDGSEPPARRGDWAGDPDSDRWRHPDMTGEWSRRAMPPLDPAPPERGDDRRGRDDRGPEDTGRRGGARPTPEDTGNWRAEERGRRRDSGHRPGGPRDDGLDTGSWERMTDTGQYDSTTSTSEWDRLVGSIEDEEAEEKFEAFWSGHRLAGDDPRWVETPATAPRSPAVGLPEPRRPEPDGYDDGPRRPRSGPDTMARAAMPPVDATDPGWGAPARPAARRQPAAPVRSAPQRRAMWEQEEFEQLDNDNGGFMAAVLYAAAWYAVPVLAFGIWLMTLPAVAPDDCISDVTGGGCDSPRAQALEGLLSGVPQFGIALGISLIAAILLRWLGHSWRAGSVGLAAAVVGGGMAAVLNSIFTGQPLG